MADTTTPAMSGLAWMQAAGAFVSIMGLGAQGKMARIAGEREKQAADFNAWNAERTAGKLIAISQRQALEERRQGEISASRMLALAAAGGGGVSDPTIVRLLSKAEGESVYRANVALYEGETKARQLRLDAALGRVSGLQHLEEGLRTQEAYGLAGLAVGVRQGASLYAKYGLGGPATMTRTAADSVIAEGPVPGAEFV